MYELLIALYRYFFNPILTLLFFALLAYVVMSWLFTFGVVQYHNPTARGIQQFLSSIIDPLARPIRRFVPPLGQLDLSIFLLALGILFLRDYLLLAIIGNFRGA